MFDLYLASYDDNKIMKDAWENDWPLLYSQINNRGVLDNRWSAPTNGKLLVDSGAHSAHTKGIKLDLEEYIGLNFLILLLSFIALIISFIPYSCVYGLLGYGVMGYFLVVISTYKLITL